MPKVIAAITISVDGYITGPDDGPDKGLGEGGERLHYWVMGGPWSYENEPRGEPEGVDAEYFNEMTARGGAVVVGRNMYEAAGHWGDKNPFGMPVFVVTHRPEEEPETGEFTFVGDFDEAIDRAKEVAGDKDVSIGGGGDVIRQGLDAGIVDELHIIVAPVILGGGKPLFKDFTKSLDLENRGVRHPAGRPSSSSRSDGRPSDPPDSAAVTSSLRNRLADIERGCASPCQGASAFGSSTLPIRTSPPHTCDRTHGSVVALEAAREVRHEEGARRLRQSTWFDPRDRPAN